MLVVRSRVNNISVGLATLASLVLLQFSAQAQSLPENCLQLPQRTKVCPNLLYKRSPVDVEILNTKAGEMLCICLADFADLRVPANTEAGKVDQLVSLSRAAARLNMPEDTLLELIRK